MDRQMKIIENKEGYVIRHYFYDEVLSYEREMLTFTDLSLEDLIVFETKERAKEYIYQHKEELEEEVGTNKLMIVKFKARMEIGE